MLHPVITIGQDKKKYCQYFLTYQFSHVLGAQKNRLIETVLLSTHNLCFILEIRKLIFLLPTLKPVVGSYEYPQHMFCI